MDPLRATANGVRGVGHLVAKVADQTLGSYRPSKLPELTRQNYRRELTGIGMYSFGRAVFDGSTLGLIVRLSFDGVVETATLNWAVALLTATPSMGNILNFIWAKASHTRNKVRFLTGLQVAVMVFVAMLAAVPTTPVGLVALVLIVLAAWVCWSGAASVRTTIWRQNYPRHVRARVTGRLATIQLVVMGIVAAVLGAMMDDRASDWLGPAFSLQALGLEPMDVFHGFVVVAVVVSLLGTGVLARVRVRRHPKLLRDEARTGSDGSSGPSFNPIAVLRLLREDKRYGAYMKAQMQLGTGNLMVIPLMPIVLAERFNAGYDSGLLLGSSLPTLMAPLMIPIWARLLDRVHVVQFRSVHSWVFVVSTMLLFFAALWGSMVLLTLAVLVKGAAMAGGMLAWQLGHHDFAPPERSSEYMAVHVTLTGVRGVFAPLAGVGLYNLLEGSAPGHGGWVFLLCALLSTRGALGFMALRKQMDAEENRTRAHGSDGLEPAPTSRGES